MREEAATVVLAFAALCIIGGFSEAAVLVFGVACAVIGAGVVMRRSVVSVAGLFVLGVLSPFGLEYPAISEGLTLMAVTVLATAAVCGLVHVSLTADEKRRFDWRISWQAVAITILAATIVVYSVVLLSGFDSVGTFLGDPESAGAQVIVLACATAIALALLLVPSPDRANGE